MSKTLKILIGILLVVGMKANAQIVYGIPHRISSLNPFAISGIDSYEVTGLLLEPLARIDPYTRDLIPWLATKWDIDQKKKIISVRLRTDVYFQNGRKLDAEDVVFTWRAYQDPNNKGGIWTPMWSQVTDIKVKSPDQVEFQLKRIEFQVVLNILTAMRILPRDFYDFKSREKWNTRMVGSGPFQLTKFKPDQAVHLKPNLKWWGWKEFGLKPAPNLVIKPVADARLAAQMHEKRELDVYRVPPGDLDLLNNKTPSPFKNPFGYGISLGMNLRATFLKDKNVREALVLLWNREFVNDKVFGRRLRIALDSFSPLMPWYPKGEPVQFNKSRAIEKLKKAGWRAKDSKLVNAKGEELRLKVLVGSESMEQWVHFFQSDADQVGIKISIERVLDESQWWHLVNEGKFDLLAYEGPLSERPHHSVFHSKAAYNSSGLNDEKIDQLLERLEVELDPKKRKPMNAELIRALREKVIEVPGLYTDQTFYLLSARVTLDQRYPEHVWRWRLKD